MITSPSLSADTRQLLQWDSIQKDISSRVTQVDKFSLASPEPNIRCINNKQLPSSSAPHPFPEHDEVSHSSLAPLHLIGAADVSFFKQDENRGIACIIVMEYPTYKLLYQDVQEFSLDIPYISGYLAFREKDIVISMFRHLQTVHPHLYPQVLLVDGNGILHPRGLYLFSFMVWNSVFSTVW